MGSDAHGIEVWYSFFYAGGPEYPRLTREHHQESLVDDLSAANAEIPSAVVSAAMVMWKLKPEGGGLLAPTGEKVDGESLPLSIRLIPAAFVEGNDRGILLLNAFEVASKRPFVLPVLWAFFAKDAAAKWSPSSDDQANQLLFKSVLVDPASLRAGKPAWALSPGSEGDIRLLLAKDGRAFTRSGENGAITFLFRGGHSLDRHLRIDAAASEDDIADGTLRQATEGAMRLLSAAWKAYRDPAAKEDQLWISTLADLKADRAAGPMPSNGLRMKTSDSPPYVFYVLPAKPYAIIGLNYPGNLPRIEWAFATIDGQGVPQHLIDPNLLQQDRALGMISAVLRSMGDSW